MPLLCKVGIAMQAASLAQQKPRLFGAFLLLAGSTISGGHNHHAGANFAKLREYGYHRFARGGAIRHGK